MLSFYAPKTLQLLFCFALCIITDVHTAESRPQVIMLTASFFFLCLLSKAWANAVLQRLAELFFWTVGWEAHRRYASTVSLALRRHALLTTANYTSRRSSLRLKDSCVIYPAGIRSSELTTYHWLIYQPVVFNLGVWECQWDHAMLFVGILKI